MKYRHFLCLGYRIRGPFYRALDPVIFKQAKMSYLSRYAKKMDKKLLCLMKIGDKKYMDRFIENGEIYISRFKKFRDIEEAERRDTHDGITHSYQPTQVNVLVNEIPVEGIIGPIRVDEGIEAPLIYCMYGFNSSQLGTEPLFDERCSKFGNTCAVIKNDQEFFKRIKNYCKSNKLELEGRLVDYVDFDSHHGEMGAFRKFKQYEHHQEFRLVFDDKTSDKTEPLPAGAGRIELGLKAFSAFLNAVPSTEI